jgi:acetylglutamate kinase
MSEAIQSEIGRTETRESMPKPANLVIKCGGSTLARLPDSFFRDMNRLAERGTVPVIVHGGGPAINAMLEKLGIESRFVDGLRVTTPDVLAVVEMVLGGSINKEIVRRIAQSGGKAAGFSGVDGGTIRVRQADGGRLGYVGEITEVDPRLIRAAADAGFMPVVAPLGLGPDGQTYNINADTAAGAVAAALGAGQLIVVTDVPGILRTENGEKRLMPVASVADIEAMIAGGEIYGGMIPKVRAAISSLSGGVGEVVICDGSMPGVLSRIADGDRTVGTRVVP